METLQSRKAEKQKREQGSKAQTVPTNKGVEDRASKWRDSPANGGKKPGPQQEVLALKAERPAPYADLDLESSTAEYGLYASKNGDTRE
jgi:hypothetical protein